MVDTTGLHFRLKRNLCLIYCCIIWAIYAPTCIYGITKFFKLRKNIILQKRHSLITIHLLICALLLMTIFIPLIMLAFCDSSIFINIDFLKWYNYGIYTFYPVIIFFLQSLYIFIWRQWLYYYDIKFMKAASNKEWTQLIDPVFHKNNWFLNISNRKKFGTHGSFMFYKIMTLLFILTTMSEIIWPILFKSGSVIMFAGTMFTTFFWLTLCVFILITLKIKTPLFQDAFYIGIESKYWIIIMGITTIIIVSTLLMDYFIFNSSKFHVIITVTNYYLMCTATFILINISSFWVIYKNKIITSNIDEKTNENFTASNLAVAGRSVELMSLSKSKSEDIKDTITNDSTLLDVLKNDRLFDEFMLHLMKEFSIEIMLSLIEFTQFQRNVFEFAQTINAFEYDENFIPMNDEWRIKFDFFIYPTSVPNSSIVYGPLRYDEIALCKHLASNNINKMEMKIEETELINSNKNKRDKEIDYDNEIQKIEFLIRSHKLYSKYCKVGSELEIHLSFKQRKILIDCMDEFGVWVNLNNENNKQLNILFQLFEESMKEMYTLLNFSFIRFKSSWIHENK